MKLNRLFVWVGGTAIALLSLCRLQVLNIWCLGLEHHVTVFPQFPAAEQKGFLGSLRTPGGAVEVHSSFTRGDHGRVPSDSHPEGSSERTLRDNNGVCVLTGEPANVTGVYVKDILLSQVDLALDAILNQKPRKEFDLRWGIVAPDEGIRQVHIVSIWTEAL